MVSQKKGNPSECDNLAGVTQWGLGETGDTTLVFISHISARQRTVINVSQNYQNTMTVLHRCFCDSEAVAIHTCVTQSFFCLFWGSL